MGSLSDYAENSLINHIFNTAYTSVATVYVCLCTADPTDAATGASQSEVANANGYARTAVTFSAAATRKVQQTGAVTFPQASGTWGTITHWTIADSATYGAGNVLAHGAFTASFAPVAGNTPTIPSGEIQVQMLATHYTAGTISAAAADNSLNDSANGFPLFPVGAVLYISGFTGSAGNNGAATIVSSTVSKIVIANAGSPPGITLVNDAAGESVRVSLSGGLSDYAVHSLFNRMFRNQAFTKPATYVGLATVIIDDNDVAAGDITEASGTAYARVLVNPNAGAAPKWTVATTGALDNVDAITFPTPGATWGTITSCFLIDSASGAGNVLGYDNGSVQDQTVAANDTVQFAIGAFDVSLT